MKTVYRIIALCLVFVLTFSLISCFDPNKTKDPSQNETNDNGDNSERNDDSDTSNYSQLLQNVLNNDHYSDLISRAKNDLSLYNSGEFDPHPYAFLEDEGYDISAIKSGQTDCYTMSYVLDDEPNNLYMFTRVNCGEYVSNYLLRYTLSDLEMEDYDTTHFKYGQNFFIQAVFMNQEIAEMKTPVVVGESKMSMEAFERLTNEMGPFPGLDTDDVNIIMINPDKENYRLNLILLPNFNRNDKMKYDHKIVDLACLADIELKNNLYTGPMTYAELRILEKEDIPVQLYFTQDALLNHMYCKDLSEK